RKVDLRGVLFFRTSWPLTWGRPDLRKRVSLGNNLGNAPYLLVSATSAGVSTKTKKRCGLGRGCLRGSPGHPGRRDIHSGCRRPWEQHLRPARARCRRLAGSVTWLLVRLG